jgi:sugar/nucleoside kinase (ribokinase family)
MDVLGEASDGFLAETGLAKGGMALVDGETAEALRSAMPRSIRTPGGSACNTASIAAMLGIDAAFHGKVADDEVGRAYVDACEAAGVECPVKPLVDGEATASCMVFVTPDGERTMNTHLGACLALAPEDIEPHALAASDVTFVEGYLFDGGSSGQAAAWAIASASLGNATVALTLSDAGCVERHREEFLSMICSGAVGIVFANEREAMALARADTAEGAIGFLRDHADLAVVTLGSKGAVAVREGKTVRAACEPVGAVVDLTGAGDAFAAGFLASHMRGGTLADSLELAGICAASVIVNVGARPGRDLPATAAARGFEPSAAALAPR